MMPQRPAQDTAASVLPDALSDVGMAEDGLMGIPSRAARKRKGWTIGVLLFILDSHLWVCQTHGGIIL